MVTIRKVTLVLALVGATGGQFYFPEPAGPLGGDVVMYDGAVEKSRADKPGYLETFVDPYFRT